MIVFYTTLSPFKNVLKCFPFTDEPLNFGIKTLEEIRLGKALKASQTKPGKILVTCVNIISISHIIIVLIHYGFLCILSSSLFPRPR